MTLDIVVAARFSSSRVARWAICVRALVATSSAEAASVPWELFVRTPFVCSPTWWSVGKIGTRLINWQLYWHSITLSLAFFSKINSNVVLVTLVTEKRTTRQLFDRKVIPIMIANNCMKKFFITIEKKNRKKQVNKTRHKDSLNVSQRSRCERALMIVLASFQVSAPVSILDQLLLYEDRAISWVK